MEGALKHGVGVDIGEYFRALRRRKWHFLIPFFIVVGVSVALAYLLPPEYRSEATIMIERQEIPPDVVSSTVQGYVQERIKGLSEQIMTRDRLLGLIKKYDLYPEERAKGVDDQQLLSEFKDSVDVEMVSVKTASPDKSSIGLATIAFTVSFGYPDPVKSRDVTEALAGLFLEENKADRARKAAEVRAFLEQQAKDLNAEITELEAKLAKFKQERRDSLPELMSVNQRLYERTETEIDRAQERIRSLQDQIRTLSMELSLTDPYRAVVNERGERVLSPEERLSALTTEYLQLSSRYSQEHPDVKRVRREIQLLSGENHQLEATAKLVNDLQELHSKLDQALSKYTPDHPDVVRLKRSIASVERSLRQFTLQVPTGKKAAPTAPDNPQYVTLQSQLASARNELQAERNKLRELLQQRDEYERRLFETPLVERDYKILARDYDNAKKKYAEIKAKLLDARIAEELEQQSKGERFTILNHAYVPALPDSPNRLGIVILGVMLGIMAGIGSVGIAEYLDDTVRGIEGVRGISGAPPLAVIPAIEAEQKRERPRPKVDRGAQSRPRAA